METRLTTSYKSQNIKTEFILRAGISIPLILFFCQTKLLFGNAMKCLDTHLCLEISLKSKKNSASNVGYKSHSRVSHTSSGQHFVLL